MLGVSRDAVRKKSGGPPLPSLGNPCYQKKKELGLFFILEPQEHFWSSPKSHNFWVENVDIKKWVWVRPPTPSLGIFPT